MRVSSVVFFLSLIIGATGLAAQEGGATPENAPAPTAAPKPAPVKPPALPALPGAPEARPEAKPAITPPAEEPAGTFGKPPVEKAPAEPARLEKTPVAPARPAPVLTPAGENSPAARPAAPAPAKPVPAKPVKPAAPATRAVPVTPAARKPQPAPAPRRPQPAPAPVAVTPPPAASPVPAVVPPPAGSASPAGVPAMAGTLPAPAPVPGVPVNGALPAGTDAGSGYLAPVANDPAAGITETFLFPEDRYLPEFRYEPVAYPHLNQNQVATEDVAASQSSIKTSDWFFQAFSDYEVTDRSILNVVIVLSMFLIFLLRHRLQKRKKVY